MLVKHPFSIHHFRFIYSSSGSVACVESCVGRPDGEYQASCTYDCRFFVKCVFGFSFLLKCREGHFYDVDVRDCVKGNLEYLTQSKQFVYAN